MQNFVIQPDVNLVSTETMKKSLTASYNNRAVLTGPKIEEYVLEKRVSPDVNKTHIDHQYALFNKACEIFPNCYEAQFNRLLLQWK